MFLLQLIAVSICTAQILAAAHDQSQALVHMLVRLASVFIPCTQQYPMAENPCTQQYPMAEIPCTQQYPMAEIPSWYYTLE